MSENTRVTVDTFFKPSEVTRTDDDILHMVRRVRLASVDRLLENGVPNTEDELNLLNTQLVELSKDAHKNKKLEQDERANANSHDQIIAMTDMMMEQMKRQAIDSPLKPRDIAKDLESIPEVVAEVSETKIGDDGRNYEEFNLEVGEKVQRANAERFKELDNL